MKIVIASLGEHVAACKAKTYDRRDILVLRGEEVTPACVGRRLPVHDHEHPDFPQTFVTLRFTSKDQVRWRSSVPFSVDAFELEKGTYKENPFQGFTFGAQTAETHVAGPINEQAIGSRYKLTFIVGGHKIDPDVSSRAEPPPISSKSGSSSTGSRPAPSTRGETRR